MKCLHCGANSPQLLCENCRTQEILEQVFFELLRYRDETCENPFVRSYMNSFDDPAEGRRHVPELLDLFDGKTGEFCRCHYHKLTRDANFELEAEMYLSSHAAWDWKKQQIMHDLFRFYEREDFVKPWEWCELVQSTDGLSAELYEDAAQFYAFVGEYDLADALVEKLQACTEEDLVLFAKREQLSSIAQKLKTDIDRYRTKKPYWPSTEARRRRLAEIYDTKGIAHPRVTLPPQKVKESDFQPISEYMDGELDDYCVFWCEEAFNPTAAAKDIYQIAAVRVRAGEIAGTFQSWVRPWKSGAWQKSAAARGGIDLDTLKSADDVDLVMQEFFKFVGTDVLVSTQALGNQGKLLSRAARYTGMAKIDNEFFDLLDYAADCSREFDLENNTRDYLLSHFGLAEGKDAREKALRSMELYAALRKMEG